MSSSAALFLPESLVGGSVAMVVLMALMLEVFKALVSRTP